MPRRKNILISSSDGTDAKGAHIVTPDSVLSYVDATDEELKVHHTLAASSINIKVNSIWSRDFMDIALPVRHIYDLVPINPVLIKRWLESTDETMGGLCLPGKWLDTDSKDPRFIIYKNRARPSAAKSDTIQANIKVCVFRRDIDPSPELQPFDQAIWHPNSREAWEYAHTCLAPMFEEVNYPIPYERMG
jgi:hypothetical protein